MGAVRFGCGSAALGNFQANFRAVAKSEANQTDGPARPRHE